MLLGHRVNQNVGQKPFSVNGQVINLLGFVDCIQLCHWYMNVAIDDGKMNGCLHTVQAVDNIWLIGYSLLTPEFEEIRTLRCFSINKKIP
jgi:hypothetical protein